MKKIILLVAILFSVGYLKAQQQDDAVLQLYMVQKNYEKAKEQVDKWIGDPKLKDKEKPLANLWKMRVYSAIYADPTLSAKYPDANQQALAALATYQQLDPSLKQLRDGSFQDGLGSLYTGSFDKGKDYFQNKQWDSAYKYFNESQMLGNYLLANKLSSSTAPIDTLTVLYTGFAAQNAKLIDTAATQYSRLADYKIAGADYEDIYKFLIEYYSDKKDDANFKKYLAIAKELYPNDNSLWTQYEMNAMTSNTSLTDLLTKYQADAAAGGMNEDKLIGYGEALATNDKTQLNGLDSLQKVSLKLAAADAFSKAFNLNKNGLYAFNAGVIYYALYSELDDRYSSYRGEGAALKAKRADIAKLESAYADTTSQWLEQAYPILKAKTDRTKAETTSLNRTVDYLANIYYWKREATKTGGNPKDYDKYDALYKKYDAEHNTYQ
jgi:hypothetical protein